MRPPRIDLELGLEVYVTSTPRVEARLARKPLSFRVEEIPLPGFLKPRGKYAVYLMEKTMLSTPQALRKAAALLGVDQRLIGYAGMKDKEAVTRQLITVPAPLAVLEEASAEGLRLRLLGYSDKPLRRGILLGNRFTVILETGEPQALCRALEEILGLGGIPGYYGYQRFGTRRPNTHKVGSMIVKRRWMEAVREIAGKPYPYEHPRSREARRLFDEERYEEAAKAYPRSLVYERIIARRMAAGSSPLEALRALPRWLLELYVEAYASYLYNRILSRKLVAVGLDPAQPIPGEAASGCERREVAEGRCESRLPVPGYGLERLRLRGEVPGIVWGVLGEEGMDPASMRVEELEVSVEARWRRSFAPLHDASCMRDRGEAVLGFTLPRGMYASILLREVTKLGPLELGL